MARTPRVSTLPRAPEGWQEKVEKIIAQDSILRGDAHLKKTVLKILRHEETETALRNLMHEAKRKQEKFDWRILYKSIYRCAVLSYPSEHPLRKDGKRRKTFLDALQTVQKEAANITSRGFPIGPEGCEQFERMSKEVLQDTEEITRKERGAPRKVKKYFCALVLRRDFIAIFGKPMLPAIDALLTATFGPHGEISRIMRNAEQLFPPPAYPDSVRMLLPNPALDKALDILSRCSEP